MTSPTPHDRADDYTELRKRWLNRYARVQAQADKKLRDALIQAAEDAYKQLISETSKSTFSAHVKSAQIRILLREIRGILDDLFGEELKIIHLGQSDAAIAAVMAFADTDRDYLNAVFKASGGNTTDFIEGQKRSAVTGVAHAISRFAKTDKSLSQRVYDTRALANGWVKQRVTSHIIRGTGAKELARDVRKFIKPNTPGGVSYAAMRLARTEINNAFHATSVALAEDRPWVEGMRWNLSATHLTKKHDNCLCERYAGQIFSIGDVPGKPHPQCRCFVTPQVESLDVFMRHLTSGQFRSWISEAA
ncbi:MuF-like protein [Mycobacterium phage Madruga]|uniref:MuF-like protein n=1 Tax=Mycobacterium phage Madruga TaxID=1675552 RepID=A0A0K1LT11_9CAUD|nr:MuF-like protein [Mycobacterium phage Madruga]